MSIKLEINDAQYSTLVSTYNERIKALKNELGLLESTLNLLESTLNQKESISSAKITPANGYNANWKWQRKLEYLLNELGGMTSAQIVEKVLEYEPDKIEQRSKVMASVSANLSANAKEGGIYVRVQNERDDFVYSIKKE